MHRDNASVSAEAVRKIRLSAAVMAVMVPLGVSTLSASVVTYDSSSSSGIQTSTGTWGLGTTNWTTDGGVTRGTWTSNSNTAEFQMPGSGTVTVDGSQGQVGAYELLLDNAGGAGTMYMIGSGSSTLQLGAGGVVANMSNQVVQTMNSGKTAFLPIVLTASQTWSSTNLRTNSNGAGFRASGTVSSLAGTTNLTFDGNGLSDPYATGNTQSRVALLLGGNNTYSGTTTVTGGAALWLDYTVNTGSKLDDNSALILSGGSVVLNGGSGVVENVGSTTVNAGSTTFYAGANGGGTTANRIALGALTHNVSGVLDVTNAVGGLASTTTQNTNGIIGGWATVGGGSTWAVGSPDGTAANIVGSAGTTDNTPANWVATENVNVSSTGVASGQASKAINSLRLGSANVALNFASGATLTVNSGGIIAASTGQSITGGKITTGAVTSGVGELFVHTPNAFTIGSEIADNGVTPTSLVKAGGNSLTLTGANSYTGRTYVNGGSLVLDNGGSLANSNITITAGSLSGGAGGGTLNFNITGDTADQINVSAINGLALANLNFNVAFTGVQTQSEYVLVDKAVGSSYVTGTQFLSTDLDPAQWSIDYDGTTAHPGSIVLVSVPEPATVSLLAGAVSLGLLARRGRRCERNA